MFGFNEMFAEKHTHTHTARPLVELLKFSTAFATDETFHSRRLRTKPNAKLACVYVSM